MRADIYTKAFTDAAKWKSACSIICVRDPKELDMLAKQSKEWEQSLTNTNAWGTLSKFFRQPG